MQKGRTHLLDLTTISDRNRVDRFIARSSGRVLDTANHALALEDPTEDDVFTVQVGCGDGGDEELGPVGARPGVGHAEQEGAVVLAF